MPPPSAISCKAYEKQQQQSPGNNNNGTHPKVFLSDRQWPKPYVYVIFEIFPRIYAPWSHRCRRGMRRHRQHAQLHRAFLRPLLRAAHLHAACVMYGAEEILKGIRKQGHDRLRRAAGCA